ncbi:MAG: hypothetical protein M5U26_29000 [Planctomycetota bacterium]|nr:hypothetical protein [Planctomycetota bacterium]
MPLHAARQVGLLCACALLAFAARPARAGAEAPPGIPALEIRVLDDQTVVLSHGERLLAAARIRAAGGRHEPVLDPKGAWAKAELVAAGAELLRPMDWQARGGAAVSLVLRVQRLAAGAHLLLTAGPAQEEGGELLPLELAVQFFDADEKQPLRLAALDAAGPIDVPDPDDALPPEDGKPFGARALSFRGADGRRVELVRSGPARWELETCKRGRVARQRLLPDPREPSLPGSFELYLGVERDHRPPRISPLVLDKRQTPAWDPIEGAVRVYASGIDPFGFDELTVMAEIAVPPLEDGKPPEILRLPCFFWEAPSRAPAEGEFRFRFAPPRAGDYGVRILAVSSAGMLRGEAASFRAGPPASGGFVRVRPGERVFRFDDGRVWLPVGLNLAWPARQGEAESQRRRFVELARHGGNAARVWLCSWGLPLEREKPGRFDPDVAEALDDLFLAAQARDIRVILVAENAHDLAEKSKDHPYFHERGGPLTAASQFFRDNDAVRLFKRRLSYLAARYGAWRSLWAWELINEVDEAWPALKYDPEDPAAPPDEADRARRFRREILGWCGQMSQHLEALDSHRHPVCISLALPPEKPWLDLERAPGLSFIQAHGYLPEAADARSDLAFDAAAQLEAWAREAREVGRGRRPWLLGEFGYFAPSDEALAKGGGEARAKERNLRDRDGILLHNALMAGLAAGQSGAPMTWWWDRAVERHDLWKLFRGPARFARALEDLATKEDPGTLRQVSNAAEAHSAVRVLGRVGRKGMAVWIQDRRSTWSAALERNEPPPPEIGDLKIHLPALDAGTYRVTWLDPWTGETQAGEALKVEQGAEALELNVPKFRRDVGVMVEE